MAKLVRAEVEDEEEDEEEAAGLSPDSGSMRHSRAGERARGRLRAAGMGLLLLLALVGASLPYVMGAVRRPTGTVFWAVPPINSSDANQYLAFTRMTARGAWLVGDPFTSESHTPRLFLPQALLQGWLCRLTGLTPIDAFQASRAVSGALLLAAAAWMGASLLRRGGVRLLYVALVCLSAGWSWQLSLLGIHLPNGDQLQPEGNTFFTLANLPHLALSSALLTALYAGMTSYERDPRPQMLSAAAGLAFLLGWTHPFDFVPLGLGMGGALGVRAIWDRPAAAAMLPYLGAVFAGALVPAAYLVHLVATDPFYAALANDPLRVQPFAFYAVAHGPLVIGAVPVLLHAPLRRRLILPICWVAASFLFLATPLRLGGKQPRVMGGIHVPLCLLAAAGVDRAARGVARRVGRRTWGPPSAWATCGRWVYAGLLAPGAPVMLVRHAQAYQPNHQGYYMSRTMMSAFQRIDAERAPGDEAGALVIAGAWTSGWIPTWAHARVYHGHWQMTINSAAKLAERDWFFLGTTDLRFHTGSADPWARAEWLTRRGIRWVLWSPFEWTMDGRVWGVSPADVPGLEPVVVGPDVVLYQFTPGRDLPPGRALPTGLAPR